MSDFASLGLEVDSRPVGKASGELERFQRAGKGASNSATTAKSAFASMSGKMAAAAAARAVKAAVV